MVMATDGGPVQASEQGSAMDEPSGAAKATDAAQASASEQASEQERLAAWEPEWASVLRIYSGSAPSVKAWPPESAAWPVPASAR